MKLTRNLNTWCHLSTGNKKATKLRQNPSNLYLIHNFQHPIRIVTEHTRPQIMIVRWLIDMKSKPYLPTSAYESTRSKWHQSLTKLIPYLNKAIVVSMQYFDSSICGFNYDYNPRKLAWDSPYYFSSMNIYDPITKLASSWNQMHTKSGISRHSQHTRIDFQ